MIILLLSIEFAISHMLFYGRDCVLDRNKDLCCSTNEEIIRHWVGFEENRSFTHRVLSTFYKLNYWT